MGVWAPPATAARTSGKDIADLINAKCIDSRASLGGETYETWSYKTSLLGVVSGTEATQYGIKFFNLQERFCYTGLRGFSDLQERRESCKSCES